MVLHPISGFVGSASLLIAGLIISYLLGRVGLDGVLAAGFLVIIVSTLAVSLVLLMTNQWVVKSNHDSVNELIGQLRGLCEQLSAINQALMTAVGAVTTSALKQTLLSDAEYASIEGGSGVEQVIIAVQRMAAEFEDDISDRDAIVDFQGVVVSNLRKGVKYTYITERTSMNLARAHRVGWKTGGLERLIRVVLIPTERWQTLPFSVDTVFLRMESGQLEAYMLIPNGASKAERAWIKMSADYRDQWWGIAEEFIEDAETLPLSELADLVSPFLLSGAELASYQIPCRRVLGAFGVMLSIIQSS